MNNEELVQTVFQGELHTASLAIPRVVKIFISSTRNDFMEERRILLENVGPELQTHYDSTGLELAAEEKLWQILMSDPCGSQPAVPTKETSAAFTAAQKSCEDAYDSYRLLPRAEQHRCAGAKAPACRDYGEEYRLCTVLIPMKILWKTFDKPMPLKECAKPAVSRQTSREKDKVREDAIKKREEAIQRKIEERRLHTEWKKKYGSKCFMRKNSKNQGIPVEVRVWDGCKNCYCPNCVNLRGQATKEGWAKIPSRDRTQPPTYVPVRGVVPPGYNPNGRGVWMGTMQPTNTFPPLPAEPPTPYVWKSRRFGGGY